MVRIGDSLLLNRGNMAWLYRPGLHGPPVDLGPSLRVIPEPTASEAWIWSEPCAATVGCTSPDNGLQQGEVRLVDASGHQIGSPISLPADASWFPTGDVVNGGLVLAVASVGPEAEEIWNPISNQVIRFLPGADVMAASGNLVAWIAGTACLPHCTVHFTDVQTGMEQTIPLPSGVTTNDDGAFSPNGSTLALPVGIGGYWPGTPSSCRGADELANEGGDDSFLALNRRRVRAYGPESAFWSSSGRLFITVIGVTHVLTWGPGDHRATALPKVRLPILSLDPPQFQSDYPNLIAM